jgi:hypothetical protein
MKPFSNFPSFDIAFPKLNGFIHELVQEYKTGNLDSWDELDKRTHRFYSLDMMDLIESKAPGWKKMSSYSEGITRTHVTCVFLGMYMLDEFQSLSPEQQQIAKWIILFHDIDKFHIRKVKDTMHAFNSAVVAANTLPSLGFFTTYKYNELIQSWSDYTRNASIPADVKESPKPDNQKLPRILSEIDELFGQDTPASLIVKTILLHISPAVDKNYPTPSPLTEDEMQRFINPPLFPLLKVMMLSDNEGWSMFNPMVRDQQKRDALIAFERIQELIELAHK